MLVAVLLVPMLPLLAATSATVVAGPAGAALPTAGTLTPFTHNVAPNPMSMTAGPDGAMWFANQDGSIGRVTNDGVFSGLPFATAARTITAGSDGALWFTGDRQIGRLTTAMDLTTFASADADPGDIAPGPDGALWFTVRGTSAVGRITTAGVRTIFPVSGSPRAITAGPDGALWYANANGTIGRITTAGISTSFPGAGAGGADDITQGPDGALWFVNHASDAVGRVQTNGTVTTFHPQAALAPVAIATGADGFIYFRNSGGAVPSIAAITTPGDDGSLSSYTDISGSGELTKGPDGSIWAVNPTFGSVLHITSFGHDTTFPGSDLVDPRGVTKGPDGAMWFTSARNSSVVRVTPAGAMTRYRLPTDFYNAASITTGPDGALWITNGSILRLTTDGIVTRFNPGFGANDIVSGPDGALWFTANGSIGRMTTAGSATQFPLPQYTEPHGITVGGDGALWFTDARNNRIGRMTTDGALSTFADPGILMPEGITAGPDGALWFANFGSYFGADSTHGHSIGRITTAGAITVYADARIDNPSQITAGPDGALWFTTWHGDVVGRITTDGAVSTFPAGGDQQFDIAAGDDGGLWMAGYHTGTAWRIAAIGAPSAPQHVQATAGRTSAEVAWDPGADGGSAITSYEVSASPGSATCTWSGGPRRCTVTGLEPKTAYTFTVTATNEHGEGPASGASNVAKPWSTGTAFHPLAPTRVLDSRTDLGGWNGPLGESSPRTLAVDAASPVADPSAVVLNLTVTGGTQGSFVTLWPDGAPPPTSSNINFAPGETMANLATVRIGANGKIAFANARGAVDVVVDVVGFYDDGSLIGDTFHPITPTRVLDSRTSTGGWDGALHAGVARLLSLPDAVVPTTATSVVAKLTVTEGTAGSFVRVWPGGATAPPTSSVNFAPRQTVANLVSVPIGPNGVLQLANAVGDVHVVVDVVGYHGPGDGSRLHPIDPRRVLDNRVGKGLSGPWGQQQTRTLPLAGHDDLPGDATAVIANITATDATQGSFLAVSPTPGPTSTSTLNFAAGQTTASLTVVGLGTGGSVDIFNAVGTVDVVADVSGYFADY